MTVCSAMQFVAKYWSTGVQSSHPRSPNISSDSPAPVLRRRVPVHSGVSICKQTWRSCQYANSLYDIIRHSHPQTIFSSSFPFLGANCSLLCGICVTVPLSKLSSSFSPPALFFCSMSAFTSCVNVYGKGGICCGIAKLLRLPVPS